MTSVALIAIFGATAAGKTTFVNDACRANPRVGNNHHTHTQNVEQSPVFQVDGRDVVLFDTPGFDDTHVFDTEVLKHISGFLASSYQEGSKLTGIIYMHRITDIRVGGLTRRTFNVFRKLCGKDSLSNVLLVTNMWSDPPTSQQVDRETELRTHDDFFQPAIEQGATMVRRARKDKQSAHDIIRALLQKNPVDEQTQNESAQNRYQQGIKVAEDKFLTELAALRKEYDEARWQRQVEPIRAKLKAMEECQQIVRRDLEVAMERQEASEKHFTELRKRLADLGI